MKVEVLATQVREEKKITWDNGISVKYVLIDGELDSYIFWRGDIFLNLYAVLTEEEKYSYLYEMRKITSKNINLTSEEELLCFSNFEHLYTVKANFLLDYKGLVENYNFDYSTTQYFTEYNDAIQHIHDLFDNKKIKVISYEVDAVPDTDDSLIYYPRAVVRMASKELLNEFYQNITKDSYFSSIENSRKIYEEGQQ